MPNIDTKGIDAFLKEKHGEPTQRKGINTAAIDAFMKEKEETARQLEVSRSLRDMTLGTQMGDLHTQIGDIIRSNPMHAYNYLTSNAPEGEEEESVDALRGDKLSESIHAQYPDVTTQKDGYKEQAYSVASGIIERLPKSESGAYIIDGYEYSYPEAVTAMQRVVEDTIHPEMWRKNAAYRDHYTWKTYGKNYKGYVEDRFAVMKPRLQALEAKIEEKLKGYMSTVSPLHKAPDMALLGMASAQGADKLRKVKDLLQSVEKNNLWRGLDEGFDALDAASLGISSLLSNVQMTQVLGKVYNDEPLTDTEQIYYDLWDIENELEDIRSIQGQSGWNTIGTGLGTTMGMAPSFFLGMGATQNIFKLSSLGVKGALEATKAAGKKGIMKGIGRGLLETGKIAGRSASNIVKAEAMGLIAAPFLPSTWSEFASKRGDQFTMENGRLVYRPKAAWKDAANALIEQGNELAGEFVGGRISDVLGGSASMFGRMLGLDKWASKIGISATARRILGYEKPQWLKVFQRNIGYTGAVSEPLSEVWGDVASNLMKSAITGEGRFDYLNDWEYWRTTLAVSAIYGGAVNLSTMPLATQDYSKKRKVRNAFLGKVKDQVLRDQLLSISAMDDIEQMSKELARIDYTQVNNVDLAYGMDFLLADMDYKVAIGDAKESARMQQYKGVIQDAYTMAYRGVDGNTPHNAIVSAEVEDGTRYIVISGDIREGADAILMCLDANGNSVPIHRSKVKNIGNISLEDSMAEGYKKLFATDIEIERQQDIIRDFKALENPSAQDVSRVMRAFGVTPKSVGEIATLVDGSEVVVEGFNEESGKYLVKDAGDNLLDVPFYDILSEDALIAEAQGFRYSKDSVDDMEISLTQEEAIEENVEPLGDFSVGDIITTPSGTQGRIVGFADGKVMVDENTENIGGSMREAYIEEYAPEDITKGYTAPQVIQEEATPTPEAVEEVVETPQPEAEIKAVPVLEDGSVDYDSITDAQQFAELYTKERGTREMASQDVASMQSNVRDEITSLEQKAQKATTPNERIKIQKEIGTRVEKVAFYGNVLDILAPQNIEEEQSPMEESMEENGEAAEANDNRVGIVENDYSKRVDKKDAQVFNAFAEMLGLQVFFVDEVVEADGTRANAKIKGNKAYVGWRKRDRDKTISFLIGHEFTHRMQDLSPEEYEIFKDSVRKFLGEEEWNSRAASVQSTYRAQNAFILAEQIEDEVVADFVGKLVDKKGVFAKYVEAHRTNKSLLEKIADIFRAIRDFLRTKGVEEKKLDEVIENLNTLIESAASAEATGNGQRERFSIIGEQVSAEEFAEIEAERQSIIETAKANGTYLKAPNGKDTNLTPEQWVNVRTSRFKKWFGDWENDPRNASKIVDENGEPMVMIHGSPNTFTIFRRGQTEGGGSGRGIYFARAPKDASDYAYGGEDGKKYFVFLNVRNLYNSNLILGGVKYKAREFGIDDKKRIIPKVVMNAIIGASSYDEFIKNTQDSRFNGYKATIENISETTFNKIHSFFDGKGVFSSVPVVKKRLFRKDDAYLTLNHDFIGEIVVRDPNQIKSATDNVGTYSAANDDIRYSLIGEQGASALDMAEEATIRMDNLAIAREMEERGDSALNIRMATGWERGADGLWRYEIEENIPKDFFTKNLDVETTLGEILGNNHQYFKAYPSLADIKVLFSSMPYNETGVYGGYNPINRSLLMFNSDENLETFVHEIQHAIQIEEGFAIGGGEENFRFEGDTGFRQGQQYIPMTLLNENKTRKYVGKETAIKYGINSDYLDILDKEKLKESYEERKNEIPEMFHATLEDIINNPDIISLEQTIPIIKKVIDDGIAKARDAAHAKYMRIAGEVESRNVEHRLNMTPEERMASLLSKTEDVAREDQIFLRWGVDVAMKEAEVSESTERLREQGAIVDAERGDVRYSIADVLTGDQREQAIADLMRVTGRSRRTVISYLKAEESLANIILSGDNKAFLDIQVDESVPSIWSNSDYPQGTVEFSNICRKRLPFTMIYQRLQKDFPNTVFDASSLESIRQTLIANGEEVACGLCFVEDRRQLLGEIGQGFIKALKGETIELNEKQQEAIARMRESGDTYIPNLYELITLDGMKILRKEHPEIANAFVAYNNARGMQAGRLFQAYSAYHRDILNYDAKKVAKINNAGGLRIFSFSDFEAHHLIDLVQVLTDCAAKGIKVQGYTKVPQFAKAVKDTKMKVNRSLIAKAKGVVDADYIPQEGEAVSPNVVNGKRLLFDTVEGIDVNNPNFFDSTDSKNVGNILVGISDEHIRIAMLDPFVDYIIGFHTGLSEAIREQKGIADWTNYKYTQLEKILKDGKLVNADKHGINIYTEVLTPEIKTERQFVRKYLKVCEEKGWIPKYHRFLNKSKSGKFIYTKGYYKLLLDFKMFDANGRILPQEVVVPVFDNEVNARILEEYVEGEKAKAPNDELYGKVVDAMVERGVLTEAQVGEAMNQPKFSLSEETMRIFDAAKAKFGTTLDMREAGYILPDGSMLDFSGRHQVEGDASFLNGDRTVDHREISDIAYDAEDNETGIKTDLGDFLDRGAIRIDSRAGAINLNVAPTKAQKDILKRLIEHNDGYVYIDFGKGWDTEHYAEYEGARASRVLGDIDRYFDEGIKPTGNVRFSLQEVNTRFNEELATLTEENAREKILNVGTPSSILLACGIENKPIRLYGAKLLSKVRKHGYGLDDLKNLPLAMSEPIAVFNGSKPNSFAILTELRVGDNNILVALSVGKGGHDVDFNIISSVYDKRGDSVARWVNDGKMLWVDKKKALDYFSVSAPLAEAQNNQELISTTNIIQNFQNPKISTRNSLTTPEKEDIRYSIIGEIGAANLDTYGRYGSPMLALEMAREFEAEGKTAREIRLATNWERGKDGKWRYEIMDGVYRHPQDDDITAKEYRLADILDNPDLYKAYPYLKDLKVSYNAEMTPNGRYNGKGIELKSTRTPEQINSTLIHEVQHAIQYAEMFAKGGSVKSIANELVAEGKQLAEEFKNTPNVDIIRKGYLLYQIARKAMDSVKADVKATEAYRSLAGEVEARNVQKRMGMTEEQRLETLLSATEDVARDAQRILFYEAKGGAEDARYSIRDGISTLDNNTDIEGEIVGDEGVGSTTEEQVYTYLKHKHYVALDNIRKRYKRLREIARADYKEREKKRIDSIGSLRTNAAKIDYILGELDELSLPLEHQALVRIARGEIRIKWENSEDGAKRGIAAEVGLKDGEKRLYTQITDGATLYFDEAVHQWWQMVDGYARDIDTQDLRNALIEALSIAHSPKMAITQLRYIYNVEETVYNDAIALYDHEEELEIAAEKSRYDEDIAEFEANKDAVIREYEERASFFDAISAIRGTVADLRKRIDQVKEKAQRRVSNIKSQYREMRELIARVKAAVKDAMTAENMRSMQSSELRRLVNRVDKARSINEVENILVEVESIMLDASIRTQRMDMDRMLRLRLPNGESVEMWVNEQMSEGKLSAKEGREILDNMWKGKNASGVSIASRIDGTTAETLKFLHKLISPTAHTKMVEDAEAAERGAMVRVDGELKLSQSNITQNEARMAELEEKKLKGEEIYTSADAEEYAARSIYDIYLRAVMKKQDIQTILENIQEVEEMYYGNPEKKAVRDHHIECLRAEIVEAKKQYLEALKTLNEEILNLMRMGREALRSFRAMEQAHKEHIVKLGLDALGVEVNIVEKPKTSAWDRTRAFVRGTINAPYWTFQTTLKEIDHLAPNGEGDFYNHFMYGMQRCLDQFYVQQRAHIAEVAQKMRTLLKKKGNDGPLIADVIEEADSKIIATITYGKKIDRGEIINPETYDLTISNAMYLIAMWRQPRYQQSMLAHGITQEAIDAVYEAIEVENAGYIPFMNWVNNTFLPDTRLMYDKVHKQMFGVSMAEERNYFPARVIGYEEKQDISLNEVGMLPSTITGAVVQRVRNTLMPDFRMNYFKVLMGHLADMDQWSSYAPMIRDLNALCNNTLFREKCNKVMHGRGTTGDGSGSLFQNFKTTAAIAVNCYRPKKNIADDFIIGMLRGWAGSNIAFRGWTAIKQITSSPIFGLYMLDGTCQKLYVKNMAYGIANMRKLHTWALENSPSYKQRWESKFAGMDVFSKKVGEENGYGVHSKFKSSKVGKSVVTFNEAMRKFAVDFGLTPNAAVDAFSVMTGLKTIYDYELQNLMKRDGVSEPTEGMKKVAILKAEVAFNSTQQSGENIYLSQLQKDRTFASSVLTVYLNSSFGFHRLRVTGAQELWKQRYDKKYLSAIREKYGDKADEVLAEARAKALSQLSQGIVGDLLFALMSGGGTIGVFTMFGGDDDEGEIWDETKKALYVGTVNILTGGYLAGSILSNIIQGYEVSLATPFEELVRDFQKAYKLWQKAYNEEVSYLTAFGHTMNIAAKFGYGLDLETFSNIVVGLTGLFDGSGGNEAVMNILNVPQSQIKMIAGRRREGETSTQYITRIRQMESVWLSEDGSRDRELENEYNTKALRKDIVTRVAGAREWREIENLENDYKDVIKKLGWTPNARPNNRAWETGVYVAPVGDITEEEFIALQSLQDEIAYSERYLTDFAGTDENYYALLKEITELKNEIINKYEQFK